MSDSADIRVAVQHGDERAVRALLARDRSLIAGVDEHGKTPLHLAADHDQAAIALLTGGR
jgi:hypothetical protein